AYVAKLLIDAVVHGIQIQANPALPREVPVGPWTLDVYVAVVVLAIVQFLVYAASSFLSTLRNVCQQLLQERVTNTIQLQIMDRFAQLASIYQDRQRRIVVTRYFAGFIWSTITTLAGSLTYLYVAFQAIAGKLTLGDLTLYTQAASSVQTSVQGLLSGFGSMYENQLYLNDLLDPLPPPYRIQ